MDTDGYLPSTLLMPFVQFMWSMPSLSYTVYVVSFVVIQKLHSISLYQQFSPTTATTYNSLREYTVGSVQA